MTKTITILSQQKFFNMIFTFILPYEQNSNNSKNIFYPLFKDFAKMGHNIF